MGHFDLLDDGAAKHLDDLLDHAREVERLAQDLSAARVSEHLTREIRRTASGNLDLLHRIVRGRARR